MILFYPMSALLTLFYGILHRPLLSQSRKDLELLKGIPLTIRRMPMSHWMDNGHTARQIQVVDDLVEELTTLAQCAIDKAIQDTTGEASRGSLLGN